MSILIFDDTSHYVRDVFTLLYCVDIKSLSTVNLIKTCGELEVKAMARIGDECFFHVFST